MNRSEAFAIGELIEAMTGFQFTLMEKGDEEWEIDLRSPFSRLHQGTVSSVQGAAQFIKENQA